MFLDEMPGTCYFIHQRIGGAVKGFFGGGPVGAAAGFFGGGGTSQAIPSNRGGCPAGFGLTMDGGCTDVTGRGRGRTQLRGLGFQVPVPGPVGALQRFLPGGATGMQASFGGVQAPEHRSIERRTCPRKHVLGADGMCYPRSAIKNSDRWWPRPRRPLLSGGDLNAIATASRAAKRLQTTTKRLQKMGMLPKPKSASRKKPAPVHTHHGGTLKVVEEITG